MEQIYRSLKKYLSIKKKCIICGGRKFSLWAKLYYLKALKCRKCGMVSVNPHINEEGLKVFYDSYLKNRLNDKKLFKARKVMYKLERRFITHFIKRGSVLDVGCSGGFFLNEFPPENWKRRGVDIDPKAAAYAGKRFGINAISGDFPSIDFKKEKFDLVILRGVIEHCVDPVSYLKKCAQVLRPRGMLYISASPNIESFCADIYREKWRLFTPIEHIHFFSVKLLGRILHPLGIKFLEKKYFYDETPYADLPSDYRRFKRDILSLSRGRKAGIKQSVPFWGNMITSLWSKE